MAWKLLPLLAFSCAVSSCKLASGEAQYIRQKIPVAIEAGKPITIEISPSGNDRNEVGLGCSPEAWKALSKDPKKIVVRLKSPDDKSNKIIQVSPGSYSNRWGIRPFYYLFSVRGERNKKAKVEITFPDAPPGISRAEIIVDKTPIDTKLSYLFGSP